MSAGINSMSTEASSCSVCNCTGACRPVSQGGKGRCSSAPTSVLEPGAARLIAAEHLLSQVLPNVNQYDRLKLVCEIRDLLDGTTAVEVEKTKCLKCHGRGQRVHGYAMCPGPCKDCGGTGLVEQEVA